VGVIPIEFVSHSSYADGDCLLKATQVVSKACRTRGWDG